MKTGVLQDGSITSPTLVVQSSTCVCKNFLSEIALNVFYFNQTISSITANIVLGDEFSASCDSTSFIPQSFSLQYIQKAVNCVSLLIEIIQ